MQQFSPAEFYILKQLKWEIGCYMYFTTTKDVQKGGEGEMYGKSNMETYTILCKIDSQWEFAVWLRKLKQELCLNLEG